MYRQRPKSDIYPKCHHQTLDKPIPVKKHNDIRNDKLSKKYDQQRNWLKKSDLAKDVVEWLSTMGEGIPQREMSIHYVFCKELKYWIAPYYVIMH